MCGIWKHNVLLFLCGWQNIKNATKKILIIEINEHKYL